MHQIDYQKCMNKDLWVLWEGIYILLGREPNLSEFVQQEYPRYRNPLFWNTFDEIAELARGSIERHILKVELDPPNYLYCEVIPLIFLSWVQDKEINIPANLLPLLTKKNFDNKSANPEYQTQTRSHGLSEYIKKFFDEEPSIKNRVMWNKLKQENNDSDCIQEVTIWSAHDAYIAWISQNNIEQKMTKKRFLNYMSTLRNPK